MASKELKESFKIEDRKNVSWLNNKKYSKGQ